MFYSLYYSVAKMNVRSMVGGNDKCPINIING